MSRERDGQTLSSLRASEKQVEMILNQLDASGERDHAAKRKHKRFPFRIKSCAVKLQQPGDPTPRTFLVHTRNLSARGMAVLHGGFVHVGTRCTIQLITQNGSWDEIVGHVMNCRYLESGVHEIGIQFEDEIEPSDYCSAAVSYQVLLLEDDDKHARLVLHHLEALNAEVKRVDNSSDIIQQAVGGSFDCVLLNMDIDDDEGIVSAEELRRRGYAGTIVGFTAHSRADEQTKFLDAGCNQVLAKPVSPSKYARLLETVKSEALKSIYEDDPAMRDLIIDFVEQLPGEIRKLEEAYSESDMSAVELLARELKCSSGGVGFDPLSVAAGRLEAITDGSGEESQIQEELRKVVAMCRLVRAPERGEDETESDDNLDIE